MPGPADNNFFAEPMQIDYENDNDNGQDGEGVYLVEDPTLVR